MLESKEIIKEKRVEEQLIAGVRFLGTSEDIPAAFAKLEEGVGDAVIGNAIILYFWGHAGPERDIEVCYPVSAPVNSGEVCSRLLPGGQMLSIMHRGGYASLGESWKMLYQRMQTQRMGWGNGPGREIYLEGPKEHGENETAYVTEIQIPMLLQEWIGNLADGVERLAGPESMHYVMDGSSALNSDSTARQKALWVQGMIGRLEEKVGQEDDRHEVLTGCSHVFPERRVNQLRTLYEESGNLDAVIAFMHEDQSEKGANYYESPLREGSIIRVTKIPYDAGGYEKAQTSLEKRMAYCHCPMVKDSLEEAIPLSPIYCHCGAGWYHTLWEGILGEPVRVDIVRSLLQGDEVCEFAIHLPQQ